MDASLPLPGLLGRLRRLGRALGVIGLRLCSVAAGLAYVKAYTGALSVEEVGGFLYLSTLSYALNALIFVPVDSYLQARVSELETLPRRAIARLILATLGVGLVACAAVSLPFVAMGKLQAADVPWLYAVAALLYLCSSLRNLLNNRGHSLLVSGMIVMESAGRLLAFVAMASWLAPTARTLMISSAAALAAELAVILWQCAHRLPLDASAEPLDPPRAITRTAAALAGGAACNTVQLQSYRVLYPLQGLGAISGAFGVVANVGAVAMSSCAAIYSQLQLPALYRSQGGTLGRYVGGATALALGVLAVAMLAREPIIARLTQPQYLPHAAAIGFGVVIEGCNLLIGAFGVYLTLRQRAVVLFKFHAVAAVAALLGGAATLRWAPGDPMLIGLVVAGTQLLITPAMGLYIWRTRTGTH